MDGLKVGHQTNQQSPRSLACYADTALVSSKASRYGIAGIQFKKAFTHSRGLSRSRAGIDGGSRLPPNHAHHPRRRHGGFGRAGGRFIRFRRAPLHAHLA